MYTALWSTGGCMGSWSGTPGNERRDDKLTHFNGTMFLPPDPPSSRGRTKSLKAIMSTSFALNFRYNKIIDVDTFIVWNISQLKVAHFILLRAKWFSEICFLRKKCDFVFGGYFGYWTQTRTWNNQTQTSAAKEKKWKATKAYLNYSTSHQAWVKKGF